MPGQPSTIVVIEDDPHVREAVSAALEFAGYDVVAASNGLEALRLLESDSRTPALILLDVRLPMMSAAELLSELRARPPLAKIPVVLLSSEADLQQRAAELGVRGAIVKDGDFDALLAGVRAATCTGESD